MALAGSLAFDFLSLLEMTCMMAAAGLGSLAFAVPALTFVSQSKDLPMLAVAAREQSSPPPPEDLTSATSIKSLVKFNSLR